MLTAIKPVRPIRPVRHSPTQQPVSPPGMSRARRVSLRSFGPRPPQAVPAVLGQQQLDSPGLSSSGRCSSTAAAAAGGGSPSWLLCPRLLTLAYCRWPLAGTSRPNPSRSRLWSRTDRRCCPRWCRHGTVAPGSSSVFLPPPLPPV